MAVYYLNRSALGRSSGGNSVASAAYRHATKMKSEPLPAGAGSIILRNAIPDTA
jgi:hypothetical protein